MTLLGLINLATGFLAYCIASRDWGRTAGLFVLFLFSFSPYIINHGLNGLETSIAGFFWMLVLDLYLGRIRPGGAIAYFSERTVINLDGVVNAQMTGIMKDKKLIPYFRDNRIDYVVIFPGHGDNFHLFNSLRAGDAKYLRKTLPDDSIVQVFKVTLP